MKKHSYIYILRSFNEAGYTLLSTSYVNSKTKLDYLCTKGHRHSIKWNDFQQGCRCPSCAGNIKTNFYLIEQAFMAEGYTLLSKHYTNCKTKLDYICPKGHYHNITWESFQQGQRCGRCKGNIQITYQEVKEAFENEGYILLSKLYKNSDSKLNFVCNNNHKHSISWHSFNNGQRCVFCSIQNRSKDFSYTWKGGVLDKDLPLYDTHAHKLVKYHKVYNIPREGLDLLGVKCIYCDKIYVPTTSAVSNRVASINNSRGENNFYCSESCKLACPTYRQRRYPKGFKQATSREIQPQLRKLVFKRDNYICQVCGDKEVQLHCHHITGVEQNPIESADIDNCITLCKNCHKEVHKLPGCGYNDFKCLKEYK